jgi:hypothetical protein
MVDTLETASICYGQSKVFLVEVVISEALPLVTISSHTLSHSFTVHSFTHYVYAYKTQA